MPSSFSKNYIQFFYASFSIPFWKVFFLLEVTLVSFSLTMEHEFLFLKYYKVSKEG